MAKFKAVITISAIHTIIFLLLHYIRVSYYHYYVGKPLTVAEMVFICTLIILDNWAIEYSWSSRWALAIATLPIIVLRLLGVRLKIDNSIAFYMVVLVSVVIAYSDNKNRFQNFTVPKITVSRQAPAQKTHIPPRNAGWLRPGNSHNEYMPVQKKTGRVGRRTDDWWRVRGGRWLEEGEVQEEWERRKRWVISDSLKTF